MIAGIQKRVLLCWAMYYFRVCSKQVNNQMLIGGKNIEVLRCLSHFWEGMELAKVRNSDENHCQDLCLKMDEIPQNCSVKRGEGASAVFSHINKLGGSKSPPATQLCLWEQNLPGSRPLMLLCSLTNSREQSYSTGYPSLHGRIPGRQTAPQNGLWISVCSDLCACWTNAAILHERGNVVKIQCRFWHRLLQYLCENRHADHCVHRSSHKDQGPKSAFGHVFLEGILGGLVVVWLVGCFVWGGGFWFCFVVFLLVSFLLLF